MNVNELRNESPERLREEIAKQCAAIRELRFTVGTREQAHVRDLRNAKRDLARLQTILTERTRTSAPNA